MVRSGGQTILTTAGVSTAWISSMVSTSTAVIWPEASSVTWDMGRDSLSVGISGPRGVGPLPGPLNCSCLTSANNAYSGRSPAYPPLDTS
jgi:hypothetical protein